MTGRGGLVLALLAVAPVLSGFASFNREARVLAAHNRERAALGIPPLRWNADLAADAQVWADHLGRTGAFEHAPENERSPQGENIWGGTRGYYAVEDQVGAWVAEKHYFKPGRFPDNSVTGHYADVGHYTQVMWRDTREVGCAWARSNVEDLLVCRYTSAGNWYGKRPF